METTIDNWYRMIAQLRAFGDHYLADQIASQVSGKVSNRQAFRFIPLTRSELDEIAEARAAARSQRVEVRSVNATAELDWQDAETRYR